MRDLNWKQYYSNVQFSLIFMSWETDSIGFFFIGNSTVDCPTHCTFVTAYRCYHFMQCSASSMSCAPRISNVFTIKTAPVSLSTQRTCGCVLWCCFSLRQGSSLERWRVPLWTNFSKWAPSKGQWQSIKAPLEKLPCIHVIWHEEVYCLCCRITLYDYQALCKEYTGSSDSARTLSDVRENISYM